MVKFSFNLIELVSVNKIVEIISHKAPCFCANLIGVAGLFCLVVGFVQFSRFLQQWFKTFMINYNVMKYAYRLNDVIRELYLRLDGLPQDSPLSGHDSKCTFHTFPCTGQSCIEIFFVRIKL